MKMSRRALRMERHHKRGGSEHAEMNLTALMDIFTLLVFFLLVNVATGETLPNAKSVKLPESVAENKPKETLIVVVNDKDIIVHGRKIADVPTVLRANSDLIQPLKEELELQTRMLVNRPVGSEPFNGEITIMGDREIPYRLLKKIMTTCVQAQYGNIKLAVTQRASAKG